MSVILGWNIEDNRAAGVLTEADADALYALPTWTEDGRLLCGNCGARLPANDRAGELAHYEACERTRESGKALAP